MKKDTIYKKHIRKMAWLVLLTGILVVTGCAVEETEDKMEAAYESISMEEAKEKMQSETDYIILDVRTQDEYEEGHIPEAICIPNESIGSEEISQLPNKEQMILVYCRSGNRSKQAAQKLAALGYSQIFEFGGIIDWDGEIER